MAQAMAVPGEVSVNATGAATYSVPIAAPPGTAGMVPSLALTYNSQTGNGVAGMGFTLEGLAAIGRCPQTVAQDGVHGAVNFDANDRFCLDGQRLMVISGTYGADGSEYRTEIESFAKVIAHGAAGSGPAWFEVRTKSGQVIEFGNSADSRILALGKAQARTWSVSKVSDTKGNYYTVTYVNDTVNGQAYPSRIDYTGNASASLAPYNSVRFVYDTARPDVMTAYHAGSMVKTTVRLTNVQTFAGSTLVSDYHFSYAQGTSTGRSQLTSLTICDGSGTCLPATSFTWVQGGYGTLLILATIANPIATADISGGVIFTGDWNGDGLTDVMRWNSSNGDNRWFVQNSFASFPEFQNPIPQANITGGTSLYFGDWNGDGLTDVMWWNRSNGTNKWYINNGVVNGSLSFTEYVNPITPSDVTTSNGFLYTGDWNGDSVTDVMMAANSNGGNTWFINNKIVGSTLNFTKYTNPITPANISGGASIYFGDWNGDGITDAMWWNKNNGHNNWFISNGAAGGTLSFTTIIDAILPANISGGTAIYFGDWNGDDITDVLWWNGSNGTNKWYINNGAGNGSLGFTGYVNPIAPSSVTTSNGFLYTGDWNGDGVTDIMVAANSNGGNWWFLNNKIVNGTFSFTEYTNPISPPNISGGASIHFGDWNGDGIADAMWWGGNNGNNNWFFNTNTPPDLLASVATGLGATASFTYYPLTESSVYVKDSGVNAASYPAIDIQAPAQVVSRLEQSDGIGGTRAITYHYAGAKGQVDGRGFLGFREETARDEQTGITQTTNYRQAFPFTGLEAFESKVKDGVTLSAVTNSHDTTNLGGTRRRVFITQSVTTGTDLNGVALPTTSTTYQYDAYGNATQIVVTNSDGYSKTTTNTYSNDTSNWLLGRLLTATVTSQAPTVASQISAASTSDTAPNPFGFTNRNDAQPSSIYEDSVVPTGFNRALTATVSGGDTPQLRKNGIGTWGASVVVNPGDRLNIRMTSSPTAGATVTATVHLGTTSADWVITTTSVPCHGLVTGGYCWYQSAVGASCDAACSGHGGCDLVGTRDYAGSGGTLQNCQNVVTAFGFGVTASDSTSSLGVGCGTVTFISTTASRYTNIETNCSASGSFYARLCACNN